MPRSAVTTQSVNDIKALQRDFERSQRAARRSPRTTETYRGRHEDDLVRLTGWSSRNMLARYAASRADDGPVRPIAASASATG